MAPRASRSIPIETVETNGVSIDYFRFGRGDRPLVILPGISVESVMTLAPAVARTYEAMTDDFTLYVFDRRKNLPATYSVRAMAEDTAAAIRTLGLKQVSLFGASQGGMMAAEIAIRDTALVGKLLLGSAPLRVTKTLEQTVAEWIRLAKAGDASALYQAFGAAVYSPELYARARDVLAESAKNVAAADLQRFVILAEAVKDYDVTDRLDGLACPVLALLSRDDRVLGEEAIGIYDAAMRTHPNLALHVYDGYGHAAYDVAPDYRERMLRFFA